MHTPPFHSVLLEESHHILWRAPLVFFHEPIGIQMRDVLLVSLCTFLGMTRIVNFIPRDYLSLNIVNG